MRVSKEVWPDKPEDTEEFESMRLSLSIVFVRLEGHVTKKKLSC